LENSAFTVLMDFHACDGITGNAAKSTTIVSKGVSHERKKIGSRRNS
jgi:hypothetical protein